MSKLEQIFFTPSVMQDDNLRRRVTLLYIILIPIFSLALILGIIGFLRSFSFEGGIGESFIFAAIFGALLFWIRKGRLTFASHLIPASMWFMITFSLWFDGGIRNPDISVLYLLVVLASLLVGSGAALIYGVLSVISSGVAYFGELNGYINPADMSEVVEPAKLAMIVMSLVLITILVRYTINSLELSSKRAAEIAESLRLRNDELLQIRESLEAQGQELTVANKELRREISIREQAEIALRQSQTEMRVILGAIPDTILRLNDDGIILDYIDAQGVEDSVRSAELVGNKMDEFIGSGNNSSMAHTHLIHALKTSAPQSFEYSAQDDNEERRSYEVRLVPVEKNEVVAIIRDITDAKLAEEALLQSQKLDSVGLLAGGIAHDFNNLLTGMLGQTSLALVKLKNDDPVRDHIQKAVLSAKRASDLTRQLLAYAGKGHIKIVPVDVNQLIYECSGLLETMLSSPADLKLNLPTNQQLIVDADRGQIQQVVMNLVINAAEAISNNGGDITVTTEEIKVTTDHDPYHVLQQPNCQPDSYARIQVSDTGSGITKSLLARVFDPYFSTKGQGRGLGLSATLGIIHGYGGDIRVTSKEGEGTSFTIFIPLSKATDTNETKTVTSKRSHFNGIVLVIDDEQSVRDAVADILSLTGANVISAPDGMTGIEIFKNRQPDISLILLDMKMPTMSGTQTMKEIRLLDKQVPIIMSSGYNEDSEGIRDVDGSTLPFLPKPYDFDHLLNTVESYLVPAVPA